MPEMKINLKFEGDSRRGQAVATFKGNVYAKNFNGFGELVTIISTWHMDLNKEERSEGKEEENGD